MKYTLAIAALLATTSALKITQLSSNQHACDFIEDNGEEVSTSLMPEYVQLEKDYVPEVASIHGDQPLFYTVPGSWKPHGSQEKGITQGKTDDGEDDTDVIALQYRYNSYM